MSANFFLDNEDLRFQFENVINWGEIVDITEAGYTLPGGHANLQDAMEFYRSVMEAVGEFSAEFIAPRWRQIDTQGNHLVDGEVVYGKAMAEIYDGIKQRELYGMNIPRELGGANCPLALWDYAGALHMSGRESAALAIWTILLEMDLDEVAYGECAEGMDWAMQLLNDVHYRIGRHYQWKRDAERAGASFVKYLHNRAHGVGSLYEQKEVEEYLAGLAKKHVAEFTP